jgi:hypothetical protein
MYARITEGSVHRISDVKIKFLRWYRGSYWKKLALNGQYVLLFSLQTELNRKEWTGFVFFTGVKYQLLREFTALMP